MFKSFAALALSGVIAITSLSPTQAQAGNNEDLAKFLVGALVLYGIADAVNDNKKKNVQRQKVITHRQHVTPHKPNRPRHTAHRPNRKHLPSYCILTHRQHYGEKRVVFGNRCLKNNFHRYASLPDRCFRRFDTVRGKRVGWGRKCLRNHGYNW